MSPNDLPKKKVLYLITKSNWGGAQRYILDVARCAPKNRYEVVLAFGGNAELKTHAEEAGIRTISLDSLVRDTALMTDTKAAREIWHVIKREQPAIIHSTSSKAGLLGTLLGRLQGVDRVIFTACAWAFNEDRSRLSRFLIKFLHWLTVLLSDRTAVISHSLAREMNWPLVKHKITVTHLAREVADLQSQTAARNFLLTHGKAKKLAMPDSPNDFWLGTIAELHPIKRLHVAIAAVAELVPDYPTLRFIIIHEGTERARLESLIQDLNLTHHVFLLGLIPDAAKYLPAFDLFTLPSKSEAFGYVLVEAGIAGLPVVATNVGGIPDIVINEQTGLLVPPDDVYALSQALRTMIENPTLRRQYATAHQRRCTENFTMTVMMEKTFSLYE
jgi:glycosyltransferase involved in cell wall biosynthesis